MTQYGELLAVIAWFKIWAWLEWITWLWSPSCDKLLISWLVWSLSTESLPSGQFALAPNRSGASGPPLWPLCWLLQLRWIQNNQIKAWLEWITWLTLSPSCDKLQSISWLVWSYSTQCLPGATRAMSGKCVRSRQAQFSGHLRKN